MISLGLSVADVANWLDIGKQKITDQIAQLKYKEPNSPRIVVLEQELVRAEAESLVAEAQLSNITREKLKAAFTYQFDALREHSEKLAIIAGYGKHLLELVDDTPVTPGETRTAYDGYEASKAYVLPFHFLRIQLTLLAASSRTVKTLLPTGCLLMRRFPRNLAPVPVPCPNVATKTAVNETREKVSTLPVKTNPCRPRTVKADSGCRPVRTVNIKTRTKRKKTRRRLRTEARLTGRVEDGRKRGPRKLEGGRAIQGGTLRPDRSDRVANIVPLG